MQGGKSSVENLGNEFSRLLTITFLLFRDDVLSTVRKVFEIIILKGVSNGIGIG